ncbi:HU family DNA-binding protein [Pseudomonas sp. NPDC089996]|uniref:HU family DNA-binding protein n=1 Tax=Pseudomonas sp. NPDC089996 TaxID=3364474 RepID=UPI0037F650BF
MNKGELIDAIADAAEISKATAGKALNAITESVREALREGNSVNLVGFGVFAIRHRAARKGRNPQTGKPLKIPAAKVPTFKAGKSLKEAVN